MITSLMFSCFWENSQKSPSGFECAVRRRMSANPILGFRDEPHGGKGVLSGIVMCMMRIHEKYEILNDDVCVRVLGLNGIHSFAITLLGLEDWPLIRVLEYNQDEIPTVKS